MIKNDIEQAIVLSMKSGKKMEVETLRFILSQIKYEEINKQKVLTDEEVVAVIAREIKKRHESVEMFKKGKRNDLVAREVSQLEVIEHYLPKQLSEEDLKKIVASIVADTADKSNMGKLIGRVMAEVKGKAEGGVVARLVRESLK